jgi:hypothetical protein
VGLIFPLVIILSPSNGFLSNWLGVVPGDSGVPYTPSDSLEIAKVVCCVPWPQAPMGVGGPVIPYVSAVGEMLRTEGHQILGRVWGCEAQDAGLDFCLYPSLGSPAAAWLLARSTAAGSAGPRGVALASDRPSLYQLSRQQ